MDQGGRVIWVFDANLDDFIQAVTNAKNTVAGLGTSIEQSEKIATPALSSLGKVAKDLSTQFLTVSIGVSAIGAQFGQAGAAISTVAQQIAGDLSDLGNVIGNVVADAASIAAGAISDFVSGLVDTITNTAVVSNALSILQRSYQSLSKIIETVVTTIDSAWSTIVSTTTGAVKNVASLFSTFFNTISSTVMSAISSVESAVSRLGTSIETVAQRFIQPIVQSQAFRTALTVASKTASLFEAGMNTLGGVLSVVGGRVEALAAPLGKVVSALAPIGGLAVNVASSIAKIGWGVATIGARGFGTALSVVADGATTALGKIASIGVAGLQASIKGLQTVAQASFVAIGAIITTSLGSAISRVDTLNNANRVFQDMGISLGDVSAATDALKTSILGLPTPLNEAISGVQLLTSATGNIGKSQQLFSALNDSILGFGGTTQDVSSAVTQLSQDLSAGTVTGTTFNSLFADNLGPVINAVAKQIGVSSAALQTGLSNGDISASKFEDTLISLDKNGGGGLKDLHDIALDSTAGISTSFQNMQTAITRGMAAIIQAIGAPAISGVLKTIGSTIEGIEDNVSALITNFKTAGGTISSFASVALPVLGLFGSALSPLLGQVPIIGSLLEQLTGPFGIILGVLGGVIAASPQLQAALGTAFQQVGAILTALAPTFTQILGLVSQVLQALGDSLAPLIAPLVGIFGDLLKAILPILPPLLQLAVDIIKKVLAPILPALVQVIKILADAFDQILIAITPILPILSQLIVTLLQQIVLPLLPLIVQLFSLFAQVIVEVVNAFLPLYPLLAPLALVLINSLAPILPQLVGAFIDLVQALLPLLPPLLQLVVLILPPLITLATVFANVIDSVLSAAIIIVVGLIRGLIDIFGELFTLLGASLKVIDDFVADFKARFSEAYHDIGNDISGIIDFFKRLPTDIITAMGDFKNLLSNVGHQIINGLIKGLKDGFNDVKATLKDLTDKMTSWKGPAAVDAKLLTPNGNLIMQSLQDGLESNYGTIRQSLQGFTKSLSSNVDIGVNTPSNFTPSTGSINLGDVVPTTNQTTIENHIGTIEISSDADAESFLDKLTRQSELVTTGLTAA